MESQDYYAQVASDNNLERTDCSLGINCTGVCVMNRYFTSHVPCGRNDYYLQYMYAGEMDVWLGEERVSMRPGDAIVYYPHTEYHYAKRSASDVVYYWAHFTGNGASGMMDACGIPNACILPLGINQAVVHAFEGIFTDFIAHDTCYEIAAAAKLSGICVELARRDTAAQGSEKVRGALFYIHRNITRPLAVREIAASQFLSESYFRTLFRQATGLAPSDYVRILRIRNAKRLLIQTDMSVNQIAASVGFTDAYYFRRVFKAETGASPTAYRRAAR